MLVQSEIGITPFGENNPIFVFLNLVPDRSLACFASPRTIMWGMRFAYPHFREAFASQYGSAFGLPTTGINPHQ